MILRQDLRQQAAIIFDFDGTVALGHGPVRAYAAAIPAEKLANSAAFTEEVEVALAELDNLTSDYRMAITLLLNSPRHKGSRPKRCHRHISRAGACLARIKHQCICPASCRSYCTQFLSTHGWY